MDHDIPYLADDLVASLQTQKFQCKDAKDQLLRQSMERTSLHVEASFFNCNLLILYLQVTIHKGFLHDLLSGCIVQVGNPF